MLTFKPLNVVMLLIGCFLSLAVFGGALAVTSIPLSQAPTTVPGDGARRITAADARVALDKGQAILVDVRGEEAYKAGHIKGALFMPWDQLLGRLDELPHDKMIVTYCT